MVCRRTVCGQADEKLSQYINRKQGLEGGGTAGMGEIDRMLLCTQETWLLEEVKMRKK